MSQQPLNLLTPVDRISDDTNNTNNNKCFPSARVRFCPRLPVLPYPELLDEVCGRW